MAAPRHSPGRMPGNDRARSTTRPPRSEGKQVRCLSWVRPRPAPRASWRTGGPSARKASPIGAGPAHGASGVLTAQARLGGSVNLPKAALIVLSSSSWNRPGQDAMDHAGSPDAAGFFGFNAQLLEHRDHLAVGLALAPPTRA